MFRRLSLALLVSLLAGCGTQGHLTAPAALQANTPAATAPANGVNAQWLGEEERLMVERALNRYMESNTPDGRVEVSEVAIEQKLFGARYHFTAKKKVFKPLKTVVFKVFGFYNKNTDMIHIEREVEVVHI